MLEDMFKLARERLCVSSDEDEETRDAFEKALCDSYSDNLVANCSSPETPTSVLPKTRKMDIKTCYSPPSLLSLRVEAVRKLNPIDLKHLSFHIFPHPFDRDSRCPIKLNMDERRSGMDVVGGGDVVDHSEVANTPPPPPPIPPPPSPLVDLKSEAMLETSPLPPPPPPSPPPPASRNTVSSPPPPPPPASRNTVSSPPPPPPASRNSISSPPPPPPPPASRNTVSSPPPPPPPASRNTVSSPPPPPPASRNTVSSPPPPPPPIATSRNTTSSPPPTPPPPASRNTISSPPPPPPPASRNTISSPPPPPPPVHFNSENPTRPPPPPPPMTSRNAAPPLMSMVNGTSPPPPPRIADTNKKATTKLKRSSEMGNLFRRLKGKIEGSSLEGKSSGKKGRIGTYTGGKQGMAEALAQITERSSYYKQIEEDVKNHSKSIKEVKAAIASFQTSDMDELIKFHKHVDSHLEKLTDESKVLARFEDFPLKKLEALRMAAALYSKLDSVTNTLQSWPIASPFGELLDKVEIYFNKIKREIDALERTKDEDSKKFRSHKINFDFSIIVRIKELMVDVSSSCMELALKENKDWKEKEKEEVKSQKRKKGSSSGDMLWKAFQLAFRVYTFAGGQDDRADKLTRELAREIEADPCQ